MTALQNLSPQNFIKLMMLTPSCCARKECVPNLCFRLKRGTSTGTVKQLNLVSVVLKVSLHKTKMSASPAATGLTSALIPPPPPPGLNYIAAIRPSLGFLLLVTPFAAVLVPILFLLFFFSTPLTRSQPIFALNVFVCFIGLAFAVVNGIIESQQILQPNTLSRTAFYVASVFITCPPLIIDSILLVRVLAFYPASTTSKLDRFRILLFPIIVKIGRAASLIAFYIHYSKKGFSIRRNCCCWRNMV